MTDATAYRAAKPLLYDGDLRLYHGDALTVLQSLPAGIAQTCCTSPPYWGLRSYLDDGHDDKHHELGLEETPDTYVARIVEVFREVRRVLRDDGTLWLNLGDSYAANSKWGTDSEEAIARKRAHGQSDKSSWLSGQSTPVQHPTKQKDLVGIPWMVAFALRADGWYLRSDIIWSKPNPMPESVTDRPTKAHEYVFLFSKQPRYYFDQDAVREAHNPRWLDAWQRHPKNEIEANPESPVRAHSNGGRGGGMGYPEAGRNLRSVWQIATEPFPEAHFATYPQELVRRCIQAGTSERGECAECGAPRRRRTSTEYVKSPVHGAGSVVGRHQETGANGWDGSGLPRLNKEVTTTGWEPSCSCRQSDERLPGDNNDHRLQPVPDVPQLVLDPFVGSGTTALVARKHGRRSIGIDLSAEYLEIAARRTQQLSLLGGAA